MIVFDNKLVNYNNIKYVMIHTLKTQLQVTSNEMSFSSNVTLSSNTIIIHLINVFVIDTLEQ